MSQEEAIRRIQEALETNKTSLDLKGLQLISLPPEIKKLTNLLYLDSSSNSLSSLPPEIEHFTSLINFNLSNNRLSSLPFEMEQLNNLKYLDLSFNKFSSFPMELVHLTNLKDLDVSFNLLPSLPPEIKQLTKLRDFDLSFNRLISLPQEIGQLTKLQKLDVSLNEISSLPPEIRNLTSLVKIDLRENLELGIPPEIIQSCLEKGAPQKALDYYFRVKKEANRPLNEAKIILVGQGAVGKTSLVKKLITGNYDPLEDKTEGIDIHQWEIKSSGEKIDLNIWDFGGQEIMHATHQFFLTKRSLYVLVLNSREDRKTNRIDYWLKMIESFGGESPVIIVCNKCDQQPMDLNWKGLMKKFPIIMAYVKKVSCKTGEGIKDIKRKIKEIIPRLPHVGDRLPSTWFEVKDKLTKMKNAGDLDYMPIEKYRQICRKNGIKNEADQDSLVNFLNDLGTMLHYGQHTILNDLNILNPEWVTNGVYSIINSPELLHNRDGKLKVKSLPKILDPDKYPPHAYLFILKMMKKFEICFEFEGSKGEKYLIPDLLSEQEKYTGEWKDSLRFEFHYDVLPGSIITRFIVRMNAFILQDTYWRNGAVIRSEDNKNRALIKSDEYEGRISIFVSGSDQERRDLLNIIRMEFHAIHSSLKHINIEERVPLPDDSVVTVSYDHLLLLKRKGIDEYIPEGSAKAYCVKQLLEGIEPAPSNQFDVFLCHNNEDKGEIRDIYEILREKGLKPWIDEDDLRPGLSWQRGLEEQIRTTKAAAVFVGKNGIGPWHEEEIEAILMNFKKRKCPVIPVILSNCTLVPELPIFLGTRHWVDFRKTKPDPIAQLIWAITGEKPFK